MLEFVSSHGKGDQDDNAPVPSQQSFGTPLIIDVHDEGEGPLLAYKLQVEDDEREQLSSLRKAPTPITYDSARQQCLAEGELGQSGFNARLKKVTFGTYLTQPACLIFITVNFQPSSPQGFRRFRKAVVELQFDDDDDDEVLKVAKVDSKRYRGPLVAKVYPEVIVGRVTTAMEEYGFQLAAPLPAGLSGGPSIGYSLSSPREGARLINGSPRGDPERRAVWTIHENSVAKDGIYPLCNIATYEELRNFKLAVSIKATTFAGISIVGKGPSSILFIPGSEFNRLPTTTSQSMTNLSGGSLSVSQKTFVPSAMTSVSSRDLEQDDLEALTGMSKMLLSNSSSASPNSGDMIM